MSSTKDKHDDAVKKFEHVMEKAGSDLERRVRDAVIHFSSQLRVFAADINEAADHAEKNADNITRGILGK